MLKFINFRNIFQLLFVLLLGYLSLDLISLRSSSKLYIPSVHISTNNSELFNFIGSQIVSGGDMVMLIRFNTLLRINFIEVVLFQLVNHFQINRDLLGSHQYAFAVLMFDLFASRVASYLVYSKSLFRVGV